MILLSKLPFMVSTNTAPKHIIFHYSPKYFSGINDNVSCDQALPEGQTVLHTGGIGDLTTQSVNWAVEDFTGMPIVGDPELHQRGISNSHYGSSAIQLQGYSAGMHVHSYSSSSSDTYKLAQLAHAWRENIFPWSYGKHSNLCIDYEAAVPTSVFHDGSINYSYMAIAVRDTVSDRVFWIRCSHYDSRGLSAPAEQLVWWQEATSVIALSYYGGRKYSAVLPRSRHFTGETWPSWRYFGSRFSREHLSSMIHEVNSQFGLGCSPNPDTYRLELVGVGPELCTSNNRQGYMSTRVRRLRVFTWLVDGGLVSQ